MYKVRWIFQSYTGSVSHRREIRMQIFWGLGGYIYLFFYNMIKPSPSYPQLVCSVKIKWRGRGKSGHFIPLLPISIADITYIILRMNC